MITLIYIGSPSNPTAHMSGNQKGSIAIIDLALTEHLYWLAVIDNDYNIAPYLICTKIHLNQSIKFNQLFSYLIYLISQRPRHMRLYGSSF